MIPKLQTAKNFTPACRFVSGLASKGLAPLIMLECFVTGGRTYNAAKRDGYIEARECFAENVTGAAFWFAGVKCFNKMNDWLGQKVLKIDKFSDMNFDVGKDAVRNPVRHFMNGAGKHLSEKQIGTFKLAKTAGSIVLANILIGFVVPKINQGITARLFNEQKEKKRQRVSMNNFLNKDRNISFQGSMSLLDAANIFESSTKVQLLSTDVGIAGGRALSARNTPDRNEKLFRDLTSIYFYIFNMPNMNRWLNQIIDHRKTRLNPIAAEQTGAELVKMLHGSSMTSSGFEQAALGNKHDIYKMTPELNAKFKNDVISLKEFLKHSPGSAELAERTSKLQPKLNGVSILTRKQVEDIFTGGVLNKPGFIANVYNVATKGDFLNGNKFVSHDSLLAIRKDIEQFVADIIKNAKGGRITKEIIKKTQRENFVKNSLYLGSGFAVSALFLSTLIPKMQYWITTKTTGKNSFPGITEYSD